MQSSRKAVYVNAFVGLVLFGFIMYPVLSSAQGLRDRGMARKDDFKERMETARMERSKKIEDKRDEWKERFKKISDERKAKLAAQLAEQMNNLNERFTNGYLSFLDRLSAIVAKIETRAADLGGTTNIATVTAKITTAKASIEAAKSAVLTQQGKVYDVTFTSESKLREAFQGVKKQLQADHAALRTQIGSAKQAVQDAFAALKLLVKE